MITTNRITSADDLARLVAEINDASWDEANDMAAYDVDELAAYLDRQDTVFVACHHIDGMTRALLGIASGRLEIKPYDRERWLYVDEVDVCADLRRRGTGTAIMQKLLEIARDAGCVEVWLGTEVDNHPANALYGSLDPSERETFVGYTWEISVE
jgi:GNAT superfamily N-acetyltransferase